MALTQDNSIPPPPPLRKKEEGKVSQTNLTLRFFLTSAIIN